MLSFVQFSGVSTASHYARILVEFDGQDIPWHYMPGISAVTCLAKEE